jgi:hypothetical protein
MVACSSNFEGPWTRASGGEAKLSVAGLVEGEEVWLEVIDNDAKTSRLRLQLGFNPVNSVGWERYRVVKKVKEGAVSCPTTVEVQVNGSTH